MGRAANGHLTDTRAVVYIRLDMCRFFRYPPHVKESNPVRPLPVLASLLVLAALTAAATAPSRAEEDRFIDLAAGAGARPSNTWAYRHLADLYPCAAGETPGPALLGTFRVGALILSRNHAGAEPTSKIVSTGDGTVLLNSADLGLGTATGLDITLLTAISPALEIETRYFGIDGWSESSTVSDPGGLRFEGFGLFIPGESQQAEYTSRLYNFEVNLRPRVAEGMPLVVGFRTLQLHERFEVARLVPEPESLAVSTHTNNYLYGVQIGAEPYLLGAGGPLCLEGILKAGIYGNHALQESASPLIAAEAEAKRNRAAFVGEIGLMLDYRFSRFLAIRGGYELLWLCGVALAPDQGATTDLTVPRATLNSSGTAFYQGAAASLEFVF